VSILNTPGYQKLISWHYSLELGKVFLEWELFDNRKETPYSFWRFPIRFISGREGKLDFFLSGEKTARFPNPHPKGSVV